MWLARRRATAPDWNAATSARMPTFSITIAISTSIRPKPSSERTFTFHPIGSGRRSLKRPRPSADRDLVAAYAYQAINAHGLELSGEINAPDPNPPRAHLRIRGPLARELAELHASGTDGVR